MSDTYIESPLTRSEVDARIDATVIEFGAPWCGICAAATPAIDAAFQSQPRIERFKIWDGPGKPLGRSFGIKLWPTLVMLRGGKEVGRLVRPTDSKTIADELARLVSA